jgi:hypothetical protein
MVCDQTLYIKIHCAIPFITYLFKGILIDF